MPSSAAKPPKPAKAPKAAKPNRIKQLGQAYKITKQADPQIGLILLGTFVFSAAVGFALFWLLPPAWLVFDIISGLLVGVLGGGSYWSHYLIELVPVSAIGAGVLIGRLRPRARGLVLAAAVAAALASTVIATERVAALQPRSGDMRVAAWIRGHDRPGDSFYALYARADLNEAVGLRTPYPYSWSLMARARADARSPSTPEVGAHPTTPRV